MNRKIFFILTIVSSLMLSSCGAFLNSMKQNQSASKENGSIDKSYWGKWQRMDTGEYFYIDSNYVYKGEQPSSRIFHNGDTFGMDDYVFDDNNIIAKKDGKNTEYLLFRVGGDTKKFTATRFF